MTAVGQLEIRRLPQAAASRCEGCGAVIVWAITVAGPNGPGGKFMPLDPIERLDGNVAVTNPTRGTLWARVLQRDEVHDRPLEYAGMTHFATCLARIHPEIPEHVLEERHASPRRKRRR